MSDQDAIAELAQRFPIKADEIPTAAMVVVGYIDEQGHSRFSYRLYGSSTVEQVGMMEVIKQFLITDGDLRRDSKDQG